MDSGPTLRQIVGEDPRFRVLSPFNRSGDEDFQAFAAGQDSKCVDAEILEGREFRLFDVKDAGATGFTHFLDGAQKSKRIGIFGFFPIYASHTSAAVLERIDREVQPPVEELYSQSLMAYAPMEAEASLKKWMDVRPVTVPGDATETTVKESIAKAIGSDREAAEILLAEKFCAEPHEGWLLIDGGIGRLLRKIPTAEKVAGIVKTHSKQYFGSAGGLATMLTIKAGQRSSVFVREGDDRQGETAYSFYLKLRESSAESPLYGVVRIEMPPRQEYVEMADEIAGWIIHERDPLSMPDPRYDRLLYPIRLVEMQLKARQPSDAAIAARIG